MIHYEPTTYGFDYGSAKVTRLFSDFKKGWVVVGIESKKQELQIYVTKTGKIRVFSKNGEMK
jgi:hypothetical protein